MKIPNLFICISSLLSLSDAAKILAVLPTPSWSHHIVYNRYLQELNGRGHEITVATPCPIDGTNMTGYRQIDFSSVMDYWHTEFDLANLSLLRTFPEVFLIAFYNTLQEMCEMYLSHPEMVKLAKGTETFDLFIVEWTIFPCVLPYMLKAGNATVGITSFSLSPMSHYNTGSTTNPAYIPEVVFPYTDRMTFFQRLRNTIYHGNVVIFQKKFFSDFDVMAKKYFGDNVPSIASLQKRVSVLLTNSHLSTDIPRPFATHVIPIGGPPFHLHGVKTKPLPKDIQEFLDGAQDGVIYFSLGSNVKSRAMPEEKRRVFLDAFRQIKQKVLWKWEDDELPGKPENVKIGKWLPQTDILAHPNVKAFITQGGLQSVGEAVYFTVPMIVIPFFADQELNARKLVSENVAIRMEYENFELDTFLTALKEIIGNPRYKQNVMRYSALTKDQPQHPMDRAIWWTEYVIRHKGAPHLRSPAVDMPWYQYFLLDVFAFLLGVVLVTLYVLYTVSRFILRIMFSNRKAKKD